MITKQLPRLGRYDRTTQTGGEFHRQPAIFYEVCVRLFWAGHRCSDASIVKFASEIV